MINKRESNQLIEALTRAALACQAGGVLSQSIRAEAPAIGAEALALSAAAEGNGLAGGLEQLGLLSTLERESIRAAGRDKDRLAATMTRLVFERSLGQRMRGQLRSEWLVPLLVVFIGVMFWSVNALVLNSFAIGMIPTDAFGGADLPPSWASQLGIFSKAMAWPAILAAGLFVFGSVAGRKTRSWSLHLPRVGPLRRRLDAWDFVRRFASSRRLGLAPAVALAAYGADAPSPGLAADTRRIQNAIEQGGSGADALRLAKSLPADVSETLARIAEAEASMAAEPLEACARHLNHELSREIQDTAYSLWIAMTVLTVCAMGLNHPLAALQPLISYIERLA